MTVTEGDLFDERYWDKVDNARSQWRCWFRADVMSPICQGYPVDQNSLCRKHRDPS